MRKLGKLAKMDKIDTRSVDVLILAALLRARYFPSGLRGIGKDWQVSISEGLGTTRRIFFK